MSMAYIFILMKRRVGSIRPWFYGCLFVINEMKLSEYYNVLLVFSFAWEALPLITSVGDNNTCRLVSLSQELIAV